MCPMYKHGFSIKKEEFSIYTVAELRVQWHHRQRQDLISVEWNGAVLRDGVVTNICRNPVIRLTIRAMK